MNNPVNIVDSIGLSPFFRIIPPRITPPKPKPPVTQQRPGESVKDMGKRIENNIRDTQQNSKPEIRQSVPPPRGAAEPPVGGTIRLIDKVQRFFKDFFDSGGDFFQAPPGLPDQNPFMAPFFEKPKAC